MILKSWKESSEGKKDIINRDGGKKKDEDKKTKRKRITNTYCQ